MLPLALVFNLSWLMLFWSWVQAHLEDPGMVPDKWREFVVSQSGSLIIQPSVRQWQPGVTTYCEACRIPRPERAHHCSTCGTCNMRLDHHCPFIMNCVGFGNHKHFLLLLMYGMVTSIVGFVTIIPELLTLTRDLIYAAIGESSWDSSSVAISDALSLLAFGTLAMVFSALFTPMIFLHGELAIHNQTKIENNYDNMPNPYQLDNWTQNLSQLFGEPGVDWLFPVAPTNPVTDGVSYQRSDVGFDGEIVITPQGEQGEAEAMWRKRYHQPGPRGPPQG